MSEFRMVSNPQSATILIETVPITSNLEEVDGHPGLPCFLSTAWDLRAECPIDQRLTYGGTLAQATLMSSRMLAPLATKPVARTRKYHLNSFYLYHGIRHEVCAAHNGRIWLQPMEGQRQAITSTSPSDAPPRRDAEDDQALSLLGKGSGRQVLPKPRGSLAQQPSAVQEFISKQLDSLSRYESSATKSILIQCLQMGIREINKARTEDQQLKIPSTRTMYRIINEYSEARQAERNTRIAIAKLHNGEPKGYPSEQTPL